MNTHTHNFNKYSYLCFSVCTIWRWFKKKNYMEKNSIRKRQSYYDQYESYSTDAKKIKSHFKLS